MDPTVSVAAGFRAARGGDFFIFFFNSIRSCWYNSTNNPECIRIQMTHIREPDVNFSLSKPPFMRSRRFYLPVFVKFSRRAGLLREFLKLKLMTGYIPVKNMV